MRDVDCCIVGAGPAGLVLGLLLARKGVSVTVLESQSDLVRDFRGDTVHAGTLEILDQLGLADDVLLLPHAKMERLSINTPTRRIPMVDFSRLRSRFRYIALMPQEHFLAHLAGEAARYPGFSLSYRTAVTGLEREGARVARVTGRRDGEPFSLSARVIIGADGRFSRIRKLLGLEGIHQSPAMDVAWIRLSRQPGDPADEGAFFIANGRMCVLLGRPENWQVGYVFPKGDFNEIRAGGIEAIREDIARIVPHFANRVDEITGFDDLHLLSVRADRLRKWHDAGVMMIGDAAHAMSPVGGVGINYAIGDAVEAANVLLPKLNAGIEVLDDDLAEIQRRRERPTAMIQRIQGVIQDLIVRRALSGRDFSLPLPARLLLATPGLRDIPMRTIALGVKRVRIEDP